MSATDGAWKMHALLREAGTAHTHRLVRNDVAMVQPDRTIMTGSTSTYFAVHSSSNMQRPN